MASNEQTPLLHTVIVYPQRPRYTHSIIRRFCTIALATTLIVIVILFLLPVRWLPGKLENGGDFSVFRQWSSPLPSKSWPESEGLPYKELQDVLLTTPTEERAREWSQHFSSGPHLAGKNLSLAVWQKELWDGFVGPSLTSSIVSYDVYLNYPLGHRLALLEKNTTSSQMSLVQGNEGVVQENYTIKYECSLEEDMLEEDGTTGLKDRIPTFHGYSASGSVTAQFVYVNYGTSWDFEDLVNANVSLKGKIAVARYGRNFRGTKVQRAQELGMVGVIMYSDPGDDGDQTEEKGHKPYPAGPARNPSSVQRGSTQFISKLFVSY